MKGQMKGKQHHIGFIIVILLAAIGFSSLLYVDTPIVGQATAQQGCCEIFCQEMQECPAELFHPGKQCYEIDECAIGCCIEDQGYCHNNYMQGRCNDLGYEFLKLDCSDIPQCTNPKSVSGVMEYTGISLDYNPITGASLRNDTTQRLLFQQFPAEWNYVSVDPFAANIGSFFQIAYLSKDFEKISKVEAGILGDSSLQKIQLFDDGAHQDRNSNDGVFANVWDSSRDSFTGMKRYTIDIYVKYKDGSTKNYINAKEFTVSSGVKCMPLKPFSKESGSVIFLGNQYPDLGQLKQDIASNARSMPESSLNYLIIEKNYMFRSEEDIINSIIAECGFFNQQTDTAVIFDPAQENCQKVSARIFALNPDIKYLPGFSFDKDLCIYTATLEQIIEEGAEEIPVVEITTKDNTFFWSNDVEIDFVLTDNKDINLSYIASIGEEKISGTADNNIKTTISTQLGNGEYSLSITVFDSDGNSRTSEAVAINVDSSIDFFIDVINPERDQVISQNEIEVVFAVGHSTDQEIDYEIFIDDVQKDSGNIPVREEHAVRIINIEEGAHTLTVKAIDSEGRENYIETNFEVSQ